MPKGFATFGLFKGKELNLAVTFKWSGSVPLHPSISGFFSGCFWVRQTFVKSGNSAIWVADRTHNNFLSELLRDHLCNVEGRSLERVTFFDGAIRKRDLDFLSGKFAVIFVL